jgi:negative regulator of sigma E activity
MSTVMNSEILLIHLTVSHEKLRVDKCSNQRKEQGYNQLYSSRFFIIIEEKDSNATISIVGEVPLDRL